jgi:hypothetical protein
MSLFATPILGKDDE